MMRRSGAPGNGRDGRDGASLENRDSRLEVGRRAGRSLPSTRLRRGRGRGGLPLSSRKKEAERDEAEPLLEAVENDETGDSPSSVARSKESVSEHNEETSPAVNGQEIEDGSEIDNKSQEMDENEMDENETEEESSPPPAGSTESRTLQAYIGNNIVTVLVTVGNEIIEENSSPASDSSGIPQALRRNGRVISASPPSGTPQGARTFVGHDGNLFYCHVCKDFGDVVCCDGCPRVYHGTCVPLGDPSRQSLDNDEDPWYCPDCFHKQLKGTSSSSRRLRTSNNDRRMVRRKCSECQESGGDIPMAPCDECGVYIHHPSCTGHSVDGEPSVIPLCSNCRAEAFVADEETERLRSQSKKRRRANSDLSHEMENDYDSVTDGISRNRSRSFDTMSEDLSDMDDDHEDQEIDEDDSSDDVSESGKRSGRKRHPPGFVKKRRTRPTIRHKLFQGGFSAADPSPVKRKRGRPRLTMAEKQERAAERARKKHKMKRKKKKRRKHKSHHRHGSPRSSPTNGEMVLSPTRRGHHGLVRATPAFFFFLSDNRLKIERVLSRKKPLFNRLPRGLDRTELIAREGALWWVKARTSEQQRYLNMSMRDFEKQVIAWKEEKNIKEMMMSRDPENEMGDIGDRGINGDGTNELSPADEMLTYNNHQRLYVDTSVGSKPFSTEPGKSNNRVLLELLQDMRFHPLPMFIPHRSDSEIGQIDYSKMTIPYFDVHGPISTSVGDECLGCTRGWNHYCPVLQRRIPAVEHRSKLQPPLSSPVATRIGLGLQNRVISEEEETQRVAARDAELFSVRETQTALLAKSLKEIPSNFLSQPSTRADDVVQFVEEAVAMKIPEPPKPNPPAVRAEPARKSLVRGALPTRGRKRSLDPNETGIAMDTGDDGRYGVVKKCGRCRTIIRGDTGCIQCRRAQLVINMSKRQPVSAHGSRPSKRDAGAGFLRVQTTMLGRINLKESNFDKQSEGDKEVSNAMTKMRWSPNVVLPPQKILVPTPKPKPVQQMDEEDGGIDEEEDESNRSDSWGPVEESKEATAETQLNVEIKDNEGGDDEEEKRPAFEGAEPPKQMTSGSTTSEDEMPGSRLIPVRAARQRTSARLVATASSSGTSDIYQEEDRQKLAKRHKEEADDLHKRCLSVACSGILLAMMRRDPLWLFAEPVPANVVGYSKIVKDPIDFGKIRSKVLSGGYSSFGAFISDARRLCTNALAFNPPGSIYSKTAKELYDVLEVMQKRASNWIGAIRDAHASSFGWRGTAMRQMGEESEEDSPMLSPAEHDPFRELRKTWPEAVDMLENGDWARLQIDADFMRTRENEFAYYGSLAVRRAAAAAEASLAPYPDKGGTHNVVMRRSHVEDEALRRHVDDCVSDLVNPVQLKEIPTWREEAIIRILRRVQSRRVEGRVASENGCARCDGIRIEPEAKMAMRAESVKWGRNKKKGENETLPRMHESRLALSTGLASAKARELVEKENNDETAHAKVGTVSHVSVSVRGSGIHGWGLFADQPFKKGEVVAEYIGEYISNPVADAREKMYQEQRIQDYQFRVDENLVIDATMRGGHGRYINHNCNPNCVAKIIDGEEPNQHLKRVLIISQRDIKEREEITYDYQFPLELDLDERIPCNCGSLLCRGFMNWDLPEKGSQNRVMRTQKRGGNMRDRIRRLGRPLKKET